MTGLRPNRDGTVTLPPRGLTARSGDQLAWGENVTRRLNYLRALPTGWDGYSGLPLQREIADFAQDLLNRLCTATTPEPDIVPLSSGGLQVEWHVSAVEIELMIDTPGHVKAWIADQRDPAGEEIILADHFEKLLPAIDKLG